MYRAAVIGRAHSTPVRLQIAVAGALKVLLVQVLFWAVGPRMLSEEHRVPNLHGVLPFTLLSGDLQCARGRAGRSLQVREGGANLNASCTTCSERDDF